VAALALDCQKGIQVYLRFAIHFDGGNLNYRQRKRPKSSTHPRQQLPNFVLPHCSVACQLQTGKNDGFRDSCSTLHRARSIAFSGLAPLYVARTLSPVSDLLDHIEQSIKSRGLFREGQPILVAVSGGLDSMVLLSALSELSPKHGWKLAVAHFNHQLRGRSSDADERLVRRTAERLGLRIVTQSADVRKFAAAHRVSIEMAARKLRHDFLSRTASRLKISTIALAHHADDQLELFFLRLLRGSGGEGLAGMKWRNPSPSDARIQVVRPLLDLPKSVLREFAARKKILFREDASNKCLDYQRNRIRHGLLPLLRRKYQPALDRTVLRVMDIIGEQADFVTSAARDWLERTPQRLTLNAPRSTAFDRLPIAVQRRVVQLQLPALGIKADHALVETLRLAPDRSVAVSVSKPQDNAFASEFVSRKATGRLELQRPEPKTPRFKTDSLAADLTDGAGEILFGGVRINWRILSRKWNRAPKYKAGCETFDAEKVGSPILLRHWQPGDRFQPIGMANSLKLQDFFTNEKVPGSRRHELLVAANKSGDLFWVEGLRISERFKLTKQTKRGLQWCWQRL